MATDRIAAKLLSDLKRDFGLTDAQAAGVVGNLMHESGGFQQLQERNPAVKGSEGGYGYAQWTGPRRDAFEAYAERNGLEPGSYEANYGYLKHELATDPYERRQFNTVKKAQTAEEAARLVSENFLRPGKPNLSERTRLAQQALGYANSPVPPDDVGSGNAVATQLDTQDPSLGGKNPGPMFDAAYDSTIGSMRMLNNPIQSQGMAWGDSAPSPASVEDRVTARNTADRIATPQPGASDLVRGSNGWQTIATIPSRAPAPLTASDRVRGNELQTRENATTIEYVPTNGNLGSGPIGQPPATRVVQSVPVPAPLPPPRQQVSASDMVRGNTPAPTGSSNFAMPDLATSPFTKAAAFSGGADFPYNGTPLPPLGDFDVAGKDQGRLDANVFPMAPGGFMPDLATMPMASPNAMPPMPRARPMIAQPQRLPQRSPLSIVVSGANVRQPAPLPQLTAVQKLKSQGMSDAQAYAAANANAKSRAQQNAQGYTAPKSGERRYDPDSGQWR